MAMKAGSSVFLDTNVLVYATIPQSPIYQIAQNAILGHKQAGDEIWISRQVIREYLATLTRPNTFTSLGKPIPIETLLAEVRLFESQYRVAEDNHVVTRELLNLMAQVPIGGKQVHDANIVATMFAYGIMQLLTNNTADFNRFSHLITVLSIYRETEKRS